MKNPILKVFGLSLIIFFEIIIFYKDRLADTLLMIDVSINNYEVNDGLISVFREWVIKHNNIFEYPTYIYALLILLIIFSILFLFFKRSSLRKTYLLVKLFTFIFFFIYIICSMYCRTYNAEPMNIDQNNIPSVDAF